MDKNEKRKDKRNFFERVTRDKAKKEIIKSEEKLGRKLTKEEKHAIVQWAARTAKIKTGAWALIAAMGIGGFNIGYKMLNPGEEQKPQEPSEIVETMETQETADILQTIERTESDSFRESLKVTEEQLENDNEEQLPYSKEAAEIIDEIDGLKTKEDVLAWWKNLYIEEYEKMTGDDSLTTGDIKILQSSQSFIYVLDNGDRVTHGGDIEKTKQLIQADGHTYKTESDKKIFKVISNKDGETIDCATTWGQKVIPGGDTYEEMKGYESVLEQLGFITNDTFKLMDNIDYEPLRNELKKAVTQYYTEQTQNNENQNPIVEDDGR